VSADSDDPELHPLLKAFNEWSETAGVIVVIVLTLMCVAYVVMAAIETVRTP
jgi:hypothetical protein